jgi:hypothetical protein
VYAALCALLCFVFSALVLRPWRGSLDVPYVYLGDANLNESWIKGILDHGWYWHNSDLGAPGGQQLFDYPVLSGDPLNVLVLKVLGLFSSDPAVVMNLFFLFTFPLVGVAAYLVLRRLTLSAPVAIALAVLYSLMPYHFVRGEAHLLLSAYYVVPLGAYLVLCVLQDRPLLAGRRVLVGTLALCAVIALASGSYYYSAFTIVLVAAAAVLRAVALRSRRPLLEGGAVVGAILAVSLVTLLPSFVYWAKHGTNSGVAHRHTFESELYALKFAQLVLPIEHHRIGALAHARSTYDSWFPATEASTSTPLGIVATVGLLWLLAVALVQLAAPGTRLVSRLAGSAAVASVLAVLFAWIGGLGVFVAAVEPQIRAWNRLSIFIGFFALLAVGLLLERVLGLMRPLLGALVLCGVLAVGILDQTSSTYEPAYRALAADYRSDDDFVDAIESRLPAGAMMLQLPYIRFPEAPPVQRMVDYDLMRGYLHSDDLRWTYGHVKGRDDDPNLAIADEAVPELVRDAKAAGFAGIYVDRFGYADSAASLEQQLTATTGQAPLVSPNGRLSFFQLPG